MHFTSTQHIIAAAVTAAAALAACGEDKLSYNPPVTPELVCGANEVNVDNICVCIENYEGVGGACVPVCEAGLARDDNGDCVRVCEAGFELLGDACVPVCEGDDVRDANGVCQPPPDPGTVTGRVCDYTRGIWLENATASITLDDGTVLSATTDADGNYILENVPPGEHYVNFTGPNDYTNVMAVQVAENETAIAGDDICAPLPGHLKGAVCDEVTGTWLEGATVTLDDTNGTTVTTDQFGGFMFYSVPPGTYIVTITHASGYSATRTATVTSQDITDLGPAICEGAPGSVSGRICSGGGNWLSGASVSVDVNGNPVETTTDGNGFYVLEGIPPGNYTVTVVKGSFTTTFNVEVLADQPTVLPDPVCIPPTTSMAVVTGVYDKIQDILTDLGYVKRATYNTTMPTVIDNSGTIDIIAGDNSQFWLDGFLSDPVWMSEYDIIFFNCGLDDSQLLAGTYSGQALDNLRAFADTGGSIYASDWANEVIRSAFPGRVEFDTGSSFFGESRIGINNDTLQATVTDAGLSTALGQNTITINMSLAYWVVMKPVGEQAADVRTLVEANIQKLGLISNVTVNNAPLVLRFDYGAGRVLYTSAHNEGQNTPDLENVLSYVVFEL